MGGARFVHIHRLHGALLAAHAAGHLLALPDLAGVLAGAGRAGFAMRQVPILQPLAEEGNRRSAGNLPYLVEAISGLTLPGRVWDLLLLLVLQITS